VGRSGAEVRVPLVVLALAAVRPRVVASRQVAGGNIRRPVAPGNRRRGDKRCLGAVRPRNRRNQGRRRDDRESSGRQ